MPRIYAFSRNVNSINLNTFPIHGGVKKFERKFNNNSGERDKAIDSLQKYKKGVSLRLILKDKGGNQDCLPFWLF